MFDILFGWRKASKCKKLVRRVQCRLKLLKNKRCSIVRQLREDVAQLLKYGHDQSAFDRVEQLFKDESIVTVYELLDHFCEFILIHLSYIRRCKDCPNDINEAVSSLIFASARCGDLPELPVIRKLFGERYGQRFVVVALELLPGNLVNRQIRENLSIKSVSNEVKYKLVDEIARSCLPIAPLALEYHPEKQEHQPADQSNGDQVPNIDVQTSYKKYEESQILEEGKIVQVDFSSEENKLSTSPHTCPNTVDSSTHNRFKEGAMDEDSSSESSYHMPEEMIYLDDIEEFQSPMNKDGKDQRVFVFKSTVIPTREKIYIESLEEKSGSRSYRKCGKENGKRLRRESFSWERNVSNIECALYYNETCIPNGNIKSNHPRKHHKKMEIEGNQKKCSLDRPYYACVSGSLNGELNNKKMSDNLICVSKEFESETRDCLGNWGSACSKHASPMEMKESKHPYLRAVTMPIERPKDSESDNILRSNSFPINSSSPHVHPKLPDYDELAAKFMALKKSNLQNKRI